MSSTHTVHNHCWAFPSMDCPRCNGVVYDPDQMYCEFCINMLGIQMYEEELARIESEPDT